MLLAFRNIPSISIIIRTSYGFNAMLLTSKVFMNKMHNLHTNPIDFMYHQGERRRSRRKDTAPRVREDMDTLKHADALVCSS